MGISFISRILWSRLRGVSAKATFGQRAPFRGSGCIAPMRDI
ncbi:hypothetical protein [Actibacterium sp. D379-3]